ncbi:conjugative transposon protein TraM [Chryseobacterium bernardetii]|uniref:conjugative transposon protein TraM n=1 Tax=Chryseobacterium bernardetii TaxID=1241978 RepID=UPI0040432DEE
MRACIHETTTITADGTVKLRLLESAKTPDFTIPSGSTVTAWAKFFLREFQFPGKLQINSS